MAEAEKEVVRAAGGVVWRPGPRDVDVAIIHRPRYDDWSIPKGKLAPGEPEVEGAIREVMEETGYRVRLGRPLGEVRYLKASGDIVRPKVVHYWAMDAAGGSFAPTREVDDLRWLPVDEAKELVTHDHDRDVLTRFESGPLVVGFVLVVRHATAGSRSDWTRDDRLRPLDVRGWEQSEELVRLLSNFEVQNIVSADYRRCVQTVQPLSEAISVEIQQEAVFSETGFPGNEAKAAHLIRSYGRRGEATVVCSQGDVIPELLRVLAEEEGLTLPEPLPCKKGSTWALSFDEGRLLTADYIPPPPLDI
jgi:8-oxo-dGTP diphosphatase